MQPTISTKSMREGEFGLIAFFAATTLVTLIVAGKTTESAFAFHALLGSACSLAAIFAIMNRYYDRPAERSEEHTS